MERKLSLVAYVSYRVQIIVQDIIPTKESVGYFDVIIVMHFTDEVTWVKKMHKEA